MVEILQLKGKNDEIKTYSFWIYDSRWRNIKIFITDEKQSCEYPIDVR